MKKTIKTAAVRQPHNYWITRRVYSNEAGEEFIKINGYYVGINWMLLHGWEVDIAF